jgi:hypothetical protein
MSAAITLWELGDEYRHLGREENFDTETGELLPEFAAQFEQAEGNLKLKALNTVKLAREWRVTEKALREQAAILAGRAKVLATKSQGLIGYVERELEHAGLAGTNIEDNQISIKYRKSTSVVITDEALLPAGCYEEIRKPKKTAIKDLIKAGERVDGAELQTRLSMSVK